jgi:hypothetical protein
MFCYYMKKKNVIIALICIILFLLFLLMNNILKFIEYFYDLKFLHIPKNAGTSIENSALKKNIKWGFKEWTKLNTDNIWKSSKPWYNLNKKKHITNNNPCFPWHKPPDFLQKFYKDDELFCVVRNPYSKIVSAYNYSHGKKGNKKDLNEFIKNKLENFDKNKYWNGCHILPQHNYTHGKIKCDFILKFENLEEDFSKLMNKYKIDIELKKDNKSSKNTSVKDLNKESIKLINKVYDKDFKLFKYKKL